MVDFYPITIRTERAPEGLVKVVWSDTNGRFPPYHLVGDWVREKAEAARAALKHCSDAYLREEPDYTAAIATLADRGHDLRTALFDDCLPEDRHAVVDPRAWFDKLNREAGDSIVITANADPILPIPWGLLHEHGSETGSNVDPYEEFWALRYSCATLYSGMPPQQLRTARPWQNVKLLSGIDQEVFENTRRHLPAAEQNVLVEFLDRPVGKAFSSSGCLERWRQVGDSDCVIHFFGHASGSTLRFSENDLLNINGFRTLFRRENRFDRRGTETPCVLTFLNGCASVSGLAAESFLVATADPGFCGFLGAEGKVPDRFALLFGHELLHCLMTQGLSVRQTMRRLWRKHRPMALFYGCYAHPDFAITRANSCLTPLPTAFEFCNFHPAIPTPGAGGGVAA